MQKLEEVRTIAECLNSDWRLVREVPEFDLEKGVALLKTEAMTWRSSLHDLRSCDLPELLAFSTYSWNPTTEDTSQQQSYYS